MNSSTLCTFFSKRICAVTYSLYKKKVWPSTRSISQIKLSRCCINVSSDFQKNVTSHFLHKTAGFFSTKTKVLSSEFREDLRNIAIVAHVDHGKTTLVDTLLKQSEVFDAFASEGIQERVMDSNDQERERGITIFAKNAAINYKGMKINLIDTPGHADFGGEVERIMNMVDGILLVVDSVEGPRPQTRFVLKKALERGLRAVVVVNKIDRPERQPEYAIDKTFELFCELNATDEQGDFQVVYTSATQGISGDDMMALENNMDALFKAILELPKPKIKKDAPLQILIANVDYDQFKGKLAIGRIHSGAVAQGQSVGFLKPDEQISLGKITELFVFDNMGRAKVPSASAGDIVMVAGLDQVGIGHTIVDPENPNPLPAIAVEEPTVKMTFYPNKTPFAGRDGKRLTTNEIHERLKKELDRNVSLRLKKTGSDSMESFEVSGRGEMHLTVLIETMRREGFELMVGAPTVILKEIENQKCEPYELLDIQVSPEYVGNLINLLSTRHAQLQHMDSNRASGITDVSFLIPTRGMVGLRSQVLTSTRGTAVIDSVFHSYQPYAGPIDQKERGSLVAHSDGVASTFGILGAQERGNLFVSPKDEIYQGMVVGIHQRPGDLSVNVCKQKQLDNFRSVMKEQYEGIVPPLPLTLDQAIEYIEEDELVEVTPTKVRILKNPDAPKRKSKKSA